MDCGVDCLLFAIAVGMTLVADLGVLTIALVTGLLYGCALAAELSARSCCVLALACFCCASCGLREPTVASAAAL